MQTNILEYLEATAPRLPQKIAYSNGTHGLTFSQLFLAARTVGSELLRRGYTGEPIAILMDKSPEEIAAFFGAVYAGCYYVPLDRSMPPMRLKSILQTVGARVVLVDEKGKRASEALGFDGEILCYDSLCEGSIDEDALRAVRKRQIDTDPIYVVFTSGSTGVPKGVIACHRSVIDYIEALCPALGFSENTVFANQTPLYFDAPLKELMPVIKFGATAYLVPSQLFLFPTRLCDFLNEHRVNTVCWVVSALTMISSIGVLESNPPRYLHTVAFGSEVFPQKQYALWRQALPEAIFFNLYGPTEATGMSCFWRADRELEENEPIPIGRPFHNTDLLLIGENGKRVADGETGEIYLRGTCVTLGYFENPEKTAEAFVQNPLQKHYPETVYRTGDLAYRNAHGELVFVSRRDAQIKHMGHRIELGEIEAVASACEGVHRACVVYDKVHSRILLYVCGTAEESTLRTHLKGFLPRYMLPAAICHRARLPLTPNGKLDRKALQTEAEQESVATKDR